MTITVDHQNVHRVCPPCMEGLGLDVPPQPGVITEPGEGYIARSERCCFCGRYTMDDLMVNLPPDQVPHNRRDPAWMEAAHLTAEEMTSVPEADYADDPRIVEAQ